MADPNTLRILQIDGGGTRGIIPGRWLELFANLWGINPNEFWKYFDVITGTSIGGIVALGLAKGLSPLELQGFFTTDAPWIFTTSTTTPSSMPFTITKAAIIATATPRKTFYYADTDGIGTRRLKSKLTSVFGTDTLQSMLTKVVIPSFEKNDNDPDFERLTNTPVYFSNISSSSISLLQGQNMLAVDAAMATSAAPLYFPSYPIGDKTYIDGGVTINNSAAFVQAIGQAIKPNANRYCVLSLGTGLGDVGFASTSSFQGKLMRELAEFKSDPALFAHKHKICSKEYEQLKQAVGLGASLENIYLIMFLLGAAITGPQENVAQQLQIEANQTLNQFYYYRMQYFLDPLLDTELDNTTPEILAYYKNSVTDYFNSDLDDITNFIGHLTA